MTVARDYIAKAHDAQPGLSGRDGGSFVTLHRTPSELERARRFMLDECAWLEERAAFNDCYEPLGRWAA